jgi:DNA-binding protein HU-beta
VNKTDLIDHIATQADISKAAASRALEAFIGGVKSTLKKGNSVSLVGFGTFAIRAPARRSRSRPPRCRSSGPARRSRTRCKALRPPGR